MIVFNEVIYFLACIILIQWTVIVYFTIQSYYPDMLKIQNDVSCYSQKKKDEVIWNWIHEEKYYVYPVMFRI